MAFIEDSNLERYHVYGLPDASAPEPLDETHYTMLENEMAGGYKEVRRLGTPSGIKTWKLNLPTLAGGTLLPEIDDAATSLAPTVTREQYIRNLFTYNKVGGYPFAYAWEGTYYLVDIVEDALSMTQVARGVEIYSTSLTFRERKLPGVFLPTP